jgi:hypothetical protein
MKLKNKHWGSNLGIIFGISIILSELSNILQNNETIQSYGFIIGLIVILTSVSYKNRKKQILNNQHKISILEILTGILFIYNFIIFGISHELWYSKPMYFSIIPIWIIISYTLLITGKAETIKNKI